uniref:Uncharacterized protein n=1 Tax=Rhizophora mucronata TaxID=61149 RepID=A0A2P2PLF2_RHIMU
MRIWWVIPTRTHANVAFKHPSLIMFCSHIGYVDLPPLTLSSSTGRRPRGCHCLACFDNKSNDLSFCVGKFLLLTAVMQPFH